jgi:hypothetical protein
LFVCGERGREGKRERGKEGERERGREGEREGGREREGTGGGRIIEEKNKPAPVPPYTLDTPGKSYS